MTVKTDNHNLSAKQELRAYFLSRYDTGNHDVADCFQGSGKVWAQLIVQYGVKKYLGLDVKKQRGRLAIDSAQYLKSEGWSHNVIDLDSYGSPWKHYFAALQNMPKRATIFLTIGMIRIGGGGNLQKEVERIIGIDRLNVPASIKGALNEFCIKYCLQCCYGYGINIIEARESVAEGNAKYIGLRLERKDK